MKKIYRFVLFALAGLSLVACGGEKEGGKENEETSETPVSQEEVESASPAEESQVGGFAEERSLQDTAGEDESSSDPVSEAAEPAEFDPHGSFLTDPYQIGEVITHHDYAGEVVEFTVDKVYRDEEALALINDYEGLDDYKMMNLRHEGLKDRYMVIEITEHYLGDELFGSDLPFEDFLHGNGQIFDANGELINWQFLENPKVDGYKLAPVPVGGSQKLYYMVAYEEGLIEPKYLTLHSLYVIDLAPEVLAELVKQGEKATGIYQHFPEGEAGPMVETPLFEATLKSTETGDAIKEEYWSTTGGNTTFSKNDDNIVYLKAVMEVTFNPAQDSNLTDLTELLIINYYHDLMLGYRYAFYYPTIFLETTPSGNPDDEKTIHLKPGDSREINLYFAFDKNLPPSKYPQWLNISGYMSFLMDYEIK